MKVWLIALQLAGAAFASGLAHAGVAVNLQEMVQETQRVSQEASHLILVWWIPQEFWEASLANNPRVTAESRSELLSALEDFQIVALFRGKTSLQGFVEMPSREEMIANARFESNGKAIEPADVAKINTGAQTIVATLKPLLSGMLGQLGQGMQLVIYPSKQGNQRLIDPTKPGSFEYTFYEKTFHWRTPLASLMPKKTDPKTHEEFPGNFDFNPYTGSKLSSK